MRSSLGKVAKKNGAPKTVGTHSMPIPILPLLRLIEAVPLKSFMSK